jgi:PHD/YefM family antitoxin component YafN of YafNO toxin-antitoxin module
VRIETLSVREAREQLPTVLARFRAGDRTPVGVGSHRKMEAIIIPVEVFDNLIEVRTQALDEARASVRLEGLSTPSEAEAIMKRWADGEISTAQMRRLVRRLAETE